MKRDGRRLHQSETIRGHVANSGTGESGDRVTVDLDLSHERDQRVAEESAGVGATRFCVSRRASRGVCRWLLLAWVSPTLHRARRTCGPLATEARREPDTGSVGDAHAHTSRLEGAPDLGTRPDGRRPSSRLARVEGARDTVAVSSEMARPEAL